VTSEALLDAMSQWSVAEGVPSAFAAARDGIDALLRDRGLRRTTPEMTAESLLRGAHASAVLEGSSSSLDHVREGHADEVAQDSLQVSTGLLALAPTLGHSPLQVLATLHTMAAARSLPMEKVGRPRDEGAVIRLRGLAAVIQAPPDVPGLLVAALVHAELATAAPFASHNGMIARAVERLVLVARGVDEKSLVVPEAGHLALRPAYESNLTGYRDGGRAGVHAWLLYAAQAYGAGAEASPLRSP
jgi:hypothetical protein